MNLRQKIILVRIRFLRRIISKSLSSERRLVKVYNQMIKQKLK